MGEKKNAQRKRRKKERKNSVLTMASYASNRKPSGPILNYLYRQQYMDPNLENPSSLRERFESLTFKDVLKDLNLTREEYLNALKMNIRGRSACFHERSPKNLYINNYNPRLLLLNCSNMDLTWISGNFSLLN